MFTNFLKISVRSIIKNRVFSIINITGLALGFASCIAIILYVSSELSVDKCFDKSDRIYNVCLDAKIGNEAIKGPASPGIFGPEVCNSFPEAIHFVRFDHANDVLVKVGQQSFMEEGVLFTDSSFFEVFSVPVLKGDKSNLLNHPYSMVLTEEIARKYFGEEDPVGKTLRVNNQQDFTVTGVCKNISGESHLKFDILADLRFVRNPYYDEWGSNQLTTYLELTENADVEALESKINKMIDEKMAPIFEQALNLSLEDYYASGQYYRFFLENMEDIYLRSEAQRSESNTSDISYMYLLISIALFILIIASINFMNLTTARANNRAKEVALRKVHGSSKRMLIRQFLFESILMSFISMIFAILIVELILPSFSNLVQKELHLDYLGNIWVIPSLLCGLLFVGLFTGAYSSMKLSSFNILTVFKNEFSSGKKGIWLRGSLVVFQFAISIFLIIGTSVIYRQMNYVKNKDLGYTKENIFVIERANTLRNSAKTFKEEIQNLSYVESVSLSQQVPGSDSPGNGLMIENRPEEVHVINRFYVDEDFYRVYDIELKDGRFHTKERATDTAAVIINESAIGSLSLNKTIGHRLVEPRGPGQDPFYRPIIGVHKNIHFESLHQKVRPMCFENLRSMTPDFVSISFNQEPNTQMHEEIESLWKKYTVEEPFNYYYLEDDLINLYKNEMNLGKVFTLFSILAIIIACMGLLGLASFVSNQKTKEIGIRKVLGSSMTKIVFLLVRQFTIWVVIANIIAWPLAYIVMNRWLQDFAYKDAMSIDLFILAAFISFFIAFLTVSYNSIKAGLMNPAQAIRHE